ncbi:MAG: biotin/lipoyl-binding protein, partial [Planctomycetota bacterium]|nr:biotin/lipoyl-binding protein [Planctomycetota bacterium]
MPSASSPSAAQITAAIYRLALRAWQAPTRRAAIFRMVNETHEAFPYARALFFDLETGAPDLAAISGQEDVPADIPYAAAACKIAARAQTGGLRLLRAEDFPDLSREWETVSPSGPTLWLPLRANDNTIAALWLERASDSAWAEEEIALLGVLAEGYATALARYQSRWRLVRKSLAQRKALAIMAALALVLLFWPTPVRVMAPCEVVAENPVVVTAPLNGVIAEVLVQPGQRVATGDLLFR